MEININSNNHEDEIIRLLQNGEKLKAVKYVKESQRIGLVEAKKIVDDIHLKLIRNGIGDKPVNSGCMLVLLFAISATIFLMSI